ncbi:hypothetical protein P7M47_01860 [Bisgaard Taxon 10/6]|uniref:hypothetical protein n=1 Tax=Exercitatus varius TaxID=67857 RepID=UPI00294B2F68|nr:hypothetical protein [Exercitatus varius]MDG2914727.1 hypothetical protein [Exercitatus varius]MDG2944253.1 hypothetical protein [Exercitatus varius]
MRSPEIQSVLYQLWEAESITEIITKVDAEKIDPVTFQTAIRNVHKLILDSVMTLEEEL